ncbi:riboflavin synthase subunit alpha [Marinobacterium sediminicola]|uniref:Riboflavin synthase n=1 Tax=Marinobacterium sediminicola TaxID=518898 RepID=A0ABY1RWZ8_9GAMM|nr:riboflavin synthase subunit alpha [Marinobacterium sediminicola]ULG67956.1 riboflavin synthase subunit alpha [Marinobacterium sediminicola]SMR71309.1 riboflavin synthase alpha chain [Marinobacterium sediminicola]
MFTGIVQGMASVTGCEQNAGIMQLELELPQTHADKLSLGASIAVNGTCLTITEYNGNRVRFDVIDTTLQLTNLGTLAAGDKVNFERAARIGDEIGGHLMSGHILCRAEIVEVRSSGNNRKIRFATPAEAAPYLLPKGFVGLNGCSLTLAEVDTESFSISLIPETLKQTTFGLLQVGDSVNLEVDPQTQAVVDTVQRYMALQNESAR